MYRKCAGCGLSLDPGERCNCGGFGDYSYKKNDSRRSTRKNSHRGFPLRVVKPEPPPLSAEERKAGLVIADEIMERIQRQKMAELAERHGVRN
jgi:hypothetical protein